MFRTLFISAALLTVGTIASAEQTPTPAPKHENMHGMHGKPDHKMHNKKMMHNNMEKEMHLNLSKENADKMLELHKEYDPKMDKLSDEIRTVRREIRNLELSKASADKVKPMEEKLAKLEQDLQVIHTEMQDKMGKFLPSDQVEMCKHHMEQKGFLPPPPPPPAKKK